MSARHENAVPGHGVNVFRTMEKGLGGAAGASADQDKKEPDKFALIGPVPRVLHETLSTEPRSGVMASDYWGERPEIALRAVPFTAFL
jgi:hypothetical protein